MPIRATVWGENVHEQKNRFVAENYPQGMHGQIAALLACPGVGREVLPSALSGYTGRNRGNHRRLRR